MSVLNQLIEAGNLEIALDLIENASNLIEKELKMDLFAKVSVKASLISSFAALRNLTVSAFT